MLVTFLLTIFSCKKERPTISNTLTIKTEKGVNATFKYSSATSQIANTFRVIFQQTDTLQDITIAPFIDNLNYGVISLSAPSLGVGTYDSTTYPGQLIFAYETSNWGPPTSYFMSITFTNYNPHGRITGSALRKDINGNIVETATFDFTLN